MTWTFTILPSWEENAKNKKKLMPIQIMNSVSLNNKDIVNSISNCNDIVVINSNVQGIILDDSVSC